MFLLIGLDLNQSGVKALTVVFNPSNIQTNSKWGLIYDNKKTTAFHDQVNRWKIA